MKQPISKRGDFKAPRNPQSGQFEETSPQNNPALLEHCVCLVRACSDLEPVLKFMANEADEALIAKGAAFLQSFVADFKASLLRELSVDEEALKEAKKSRLRAPYLSRGVR